MKNFIPDNVSKHDNVFDVLKERGFIEQTTVTVIISQTVS